MHVEVDDGEPFDTDEILVSIYVTADIGLETVGLEAGGYIRTDESPRVDDWTGSMRSATSTGARCSRTWGSTRDGSRPTPSWARTSVFARTEPRRRG